MANFPLFRKVKFKLFYNKFYSKISFPIALGIFHLIKIRFSNFPRPHGGSSDGGPIKKIQEIIFLIYYYGIFTMMQKNVFPMLG